MFKIFFLSELRYSFRNPMVYLFFLIVFLLVFFANVSDNVSIGGSIGNVYRNAPNVITTFSIIMTLFGLLFAAAFFNNSALRDHKNNFQEIIFSKPIDKFGYFMGKFSASLLLSTIPLTGVFFAVIIGSKIAPLMGWIEPERYGPLYLQTFVSNYFIFILPNMFIGGAIIYSLAQQFKNTTVSFVGAMLILVGYSIAGELTSDIDNEKIAALVDTFGIGTYNITSKYYTPLEKNTLNPSLSGLLLYNRIIWIGLASLILLASYSRFTFSTKKTKKNKIKAETVNNELLVSVKSLPESKISKDSMFTHFKSFFKLNMSSIYKHVTFKILFVFSIIQLIAGLASGYEYFGLKSYPLTNLMIDQISGSSGLFIIIILVFFSGELVWRDRDVQINEVIDSTPHSSLVPLFSKAL
jgi:ABC-2 type transport system permease protein